MTKYARINPDLTVERFVELVDPVIAEHKTLSDGGLYVRPVEEGEIPDHRQDIERIDKTVEVLPEKVVISYAVRLIDEDARVKLVKEEARKRILALYPEWKQANMTARAVELLDIFRLNGEWTLEETAEYEAIKAAWAQIKAIRAASDAVEAELPRDYDAGRHWSV